MSHIRRGRGFHRLNEIGHAQARPRGFRDLPLQALRARRAEALDSSRERVRCIRCRCRFDPVDGLRESDNDPNCTLCDCRWRRWASRPAPTLMILFNAALVGAYWERLLVLPLEQRRVAGREPPSEQRLEGQPGYLEELRVHLHRHRAPITATQPTDIPATDIRATRSRAMDTQATRDTPPTPVLRAMDTQATRAAAYPARVRMPSNSGYPAYSGPPGYGYQSRPLYSPYSGSGYGSPVAGYPGDRPSEDWSPGAEYGIEPAS